MKTGDRAGSSRGTKDTPGKHGKLLPVKLPGGTEDDRIMKVRSGREILRGPLREKTDGYGGLS